MPATDNGILSNIQGLLSNMLTQDVVFNANDNTNRPPKGLASMKPAILFIQALSVLQTILLCPPTLRPSGIRVLKL